jgi:hypothetical protein
MKSIHNIAKLSKDYYDAFKSVGFNEQQAVEFTKNLQLIIAGYIINRDGGI